MRELQGGELKVLLALVRGAKRQQYGNKRIRMTRKQLAHYTGLSVRSINKVIYSLSQLSMIQVYTIEGEVFVFSKKQKYQRSLVFKVKLVG